MMMKPLDRLSRSKKGQMPFAMIAVALLLMGTAYGVICANVQNCEDEADDLIDEFQSMDDALDDNRKRIESGLGEIIYSISASEYGGTLLQRMDSFKVLSDQWMSDNYPFCNRGVTATVVSHDLRLGVQSMKLSSGEIVADSSEASFLKCSGTVTIHLTNSTGESETVLDISADGTSCLPFIAGSSSEFELSAAGGSSILTQIMSYQLSSLAQSRVINGYGAFSVYGEHGVNDIITEKDVSEAFRNSLSVVETICFRSNGEDNDEFVKSLYVDAAELIILKDGYFEIDMSAVVAQVLSSMFDDLLGKWLDFIFGDSFIEIADYLSDIVIKVLYNIVDFCKNVPFLREIYDFSSPVCKFLEKKFGKSDEKTDSAVRYIRDAMEDAGYSEDYYRYISYDIGYHFEGCSVLLNDGITTFEAKDFIVSTETDVFDWNGWNGYVTDYLDKTNAIAEMIKNLLNTIVAEIANDYGTYRFTADEFDNKGFLDTYRDALQTAVSKGLNDSDYYLKSSLNYNTIYDPFYASIYKTMEDHQGEIFPGADLRIYDTFLEQYDGADYWDLYAYREIITEKCTAINSDLNVSEMYEKDVSERLALFKQVLNSVVNGNSDALKTLIVTAGKKALDLDVVSSRVETFCYGLIEDTIDNITLSTYSGVQELDGIGSFRLYDYDGNVREEYVDVKDRYDLSISITTPVDNASKNVHKVNPEELTYMPFTSVFTVGVSTVLNYTVTSASSVDMALGRNNAAISGSFNINCTFDVTCVSGWELAGCSYSPSTNLGSYLMGKLTSFTDRLIDPLCSIFRSIRDVYNVTSSMMIEIQDRLNEVITLIYEALITPITMLQELAEDTIMKLISNVLYAFDIGLAKQSITLNYFGFLVTVEFFTSTYLSKTKHILKISIEGKIGDADCSAFIDIKQNSKNEIMIEGGAGMELDDFSLDVTVDPLLKFGRRIVSATGTVRGLDFDIALPERVLYNEIELRLSDIPGVGDVLGNIVLPIPGVKVGVDAGIELKYNLPLGTGLMINEFESNPKGTDKGKEWVEIYNATAKTIDLTGYSVVPRSNENKALALSGTIAPFDHKVFYFTEQSLINDSSVKYKGEMLSLIDPEGNIVDKTPAKKDSYNDDRTWQRKSDGDSTWVFEEATEGYSNGSCFGINSVIKTFFVDTLISSAEQAFSDMGNHITSVEELLAFLQHMLKLYIEKVIDKIADMLVGASVFIEVEIQDDAELLHKGFTLAFEIGSELIEEGLHWLLRQIPYLSDFVHKPSSNDPVQLICENSYFTLSTYTTAGAPSFLKMSELQVKKVTKAGVNICGLTEIFGNDTGKWKAYAGIMLEGIDPKLLPVGLKSNQDKLCDLWLIKMEISE